MFDTELIPVRVAKWTCNALQKDGREIPLVELHCEIHPFTVQLANELDSTVRGILFSRTDGEMASKVERIALKLSIKPQAIVVRAAPEIEKPTVSIDEAKIGRIYARRDKRASAWVLCFTATVPDPSKEELWQFFDSLRKMRYCTFANAKPGLFDAEEKEERKRRSAPARGQKVSEEQSVLQ